MTLVWLWLRVGVMVLLVKSDLRIVTGPVTVRASFGFDVLCDFRNTLFAANPPEHMQHSITQGFSEKLSSVVARRRL